MIPSSRYSIRRKITELVLVTCAVAVLVACGVFAAYDIVSSRAALAHDLTTIAQIIGSKSTAALSFDDPQSASEILSSLSSKPHIVEACIYRSDGSVFAKYSRTASTADFIPPPVSPNGVRSVSGIMEVFREIRLKNAVIGMIYMKSDLKELRTRTVHFVWTTLGVILLSSLAVYFSAARLQRLISDPILDWPGPRSPFRLEKIIRSEPQSGTTTKSAFCLTVSMKCWARSRNAIALSSRRARDWNGALRNAPANSRTKSRSEIKRNGPSKNEPPS